MGCISAFFRVDIRWQRPGNGDVQNCLLSVRAQQTQFPWMPGAFLGNLAGGTRGLQSKSFPRAIKRDDTFIWEKVSFPVQRQLHDGLGSSWCPHCIRWSSGILFWEMVLVIIISYYYLWWWLVIWGFPKWAWTSLCHSLTRRCGSTCHQWAVRSWCVIDFASPSPGKNLVLGP